MRMAQLNSAPLKILFLSAVCIASAGCSRIPGRPAPGPEVVRPDQILDFPTLYKSNCAACHGEEGRNGAATPLANPVYLAIAGQSNLLQITANGVPGTLMPPFARSAGGMLTDQQINVLVQGMLSWSNPAILAGQTPPPYKATAPGDPTSGQQAFQTFCARCHGPSGEGQPTTQSSTQDASTHIGSIVDPSYLALISDQSLRTIIIAGLPGRGMPDWRSASTSQPLTDQQVTDIVAWLASKRTATPGQPYPTKP